MTAAAAAGGLAEDPALPFRDRLMDEDGVRKRLQHLIGSNGTRVQRCQRVKAKYRIGESFRVLHRVQVDGTSHLVAGRMFPRGRSRRVHDDALAQAVPTSPLPAVLHDEAIDTVFWTFPNDRKIRHLKTLSDTACGVAALEGWTRTRIASYAPERAATAACLDEGGRVLAYAKCYSNDDGAASAAVHDLLCASLGGDTHLQLPRALGYSEARRTLWVEPMSGRPFGDLAAGALVQAFHRLGAALGTFHGLPLPGAVPAFRRLDPSRLHGAATLIGRARPDAAEGAARAADALIRSFVPPDGVDVPVHGDVNFRNWLVDGVRLALIDLDQVGRGRPEADLGGALAGLRYRTLIGVFDPSTERQLARALLDGYARVRPLPNAAALDWHTGAALFVERALRAVTRFRSEGLLHLGVLVAHAQRLSRERED